MIFLKYINPLKLARIYFYNDPCVFSLQPIWNFEWIFTNIIWFILKFKFTSNNSLIKFWKN
jgi:hypothetical protein